MEASQPEPPQPQNQRSEIAKQIVRLHAEYYGRGATKARAYMVDDLVVVLLEETFTAAEKTLIARGESEPIQNIRRKFQRVMADQFRSVVEQITGRQVRVFMSETDIESDISAEFFLLGGERTDMDAFEAKASDVDQEVEEAQPEIDG